MPHISPEQLGDHLDMRVYFDICCLKRPFDDQTQTRIHLESEALLSALQFAEELFP
ncbi:MAG TPA: hypothetical protein VMV69_11585 [Pirellulales bacterium]|nr:hypothetical protein [Pirellulales bacterium]